MFPAQPPSHQGRFVCAFARGGQLIELSDKGLLHTPCLDAGSTMFASAATTLLASLRSQQHSHKVETRNLRLQQRTLRLCADSTTPSCRSTTPLPNSGSRRRNHMEGVRVL